MRDLRSVKDQTSFSKEGRDDEAINCKTQEPVLQWS